MAPCRLHWPNKEEPSSCVPIIITPRLVFYPRLSASPATFPASGRHIVGAQLAPIERAMRREDHRRCMSEDRRPEFRGGRAELSSFVLQGPRSAGMSGRPSFIQCSTCHSVSTEKSTTEPSPCVCVSAKKSTTEPSPCVPLCHLTEM